MSRRINFTVTTDELAAVETAMHHAPQVGVRQRATAIRLLHLGHKPEAVAEMLAVAPSTVWNWHRRYRTDGVAGLANQPAQEWTTGQSGCRLCASRRDGAGDRPT